MIRSIWRVIAVVCVAGLSVGGGVARADIDINGGASWNGWEYAGKNNDLGRWAAGSIDSLFDIYTTSFVLTATQTVAGTGDRGNTPTFYTPGNLLANLSYHVGDRIVGVGIQSISPYHNVNNTSGFDLDYFFLAFDTDGQDYHAASSVGGGDGVFLASVAGEKGEFGIQLNGIQNDTKRWRTNYYTVYKVDHPVGPLNTIYNFPFGDDTSVTAETPGRSFAVLNPNAQFDYTFSALSVQYLYNIDAALRSAALTTAGQNHFSKNFTVVVSAFDPDFGGSFASVPMSVPEPSSCLLLFLSVAVMAPRRRGWISGE